jgi:hypothetical protein
MVLTSGSLCFFNARTSLPTPFNKKKRKKEKDRLTQRKRAHTKKVNVNGEIDERMKSFTRIM